jgi:chain length determinant protein EpsF
MSFTQFLSVLKARWRSALMVLLATIAAAGVVTVLMPSKYTATTSVLVDVKSPDPIAGMVFGAMSNPSYMATQVDLLQSDKVAQQVVRNLKLVDNSTLRSQWLENTSGQGSFEAWAANLLKNNLKVAPARDSNIISISYVAQDPAFSAALANAFANAYVQTVLELRVSPAKQYNAFFEEQTKDLRTRLESAQARLSAYQKEHGILATDERLDVENQRLNELSSQLVAAQSISAESRSRSAAATTSPNTLQDSINNPVVAGLRADLSRQRAKLQELNANLGDNHPQVMELRASIDELQQRIDGEVARVSSSVGVTNTINLGREGSIRSALEAQRGKVAKMRTEREQLTVLLKDVDAAQRAYDAVYQRQTQSNLESQNNQTNVALLAPATAPASPSSPRLLVNFALAIVVGLVLAIGTALLGELMDRRLRSYEDITALLDLPVLGDLPRPHRLERKTGRGSDKLVMPAHFMRRLPVTPR